jgi:hypothetical protein
MQRNVDVTMSPSTPLLPPPTAVLPRLPKFAFSSLGSMKRKGVEIRRVQPRKSVDVSTFGPTIPEGFETSVKGTAKKGKKRARYFI